MGSRDDKSAALAERYHAGEFSADVYRASLFALGWRGADLDSIIKQEMEIQHARQTSRRTRLQSGTN